MIVIVYSNELLSCLHGQNVMHGFLHRLADIRFVHVIKSVCFFYYCLLLPLIWLGKKIYWGVFKDTADKKQRAEQVVLHAARKKGNLEKYGVVDLATELKTFEEEVEVKSKSCKSTVVDSKAVLDNVLVQKNLQKGREEKKTAEQQSKKKLKKKDKLQMKGRDKLSRNTAAGGDSLTDPHLREKRVRGEVVLERGHLMPGEGYGGRDRPGNRTSEGARRESRRGRKYRGKKYRGSNKKRGQSGKDEGTAESTIGVDNASGPSNEGGSDNYAHERLDGEEHSDSKDEHSGSGDEHSSNGEGTGSGDEH